MDITPVDSPGRHIYGWSVFENTHPCNGNSGAGLIVPIAEYSRGPGCSVTNGYIYRQAMREW